MLEKTIYVILLVFIVLISTSCNNAKDKKPNILPKEQSKTETVKGSLNDFDASESRKLEVTKQKYVKKEVEIYYPQVAGLNNSNNQKKINEIIKNEALKAMNYYDGDYSDLSLKIDYKILFNSTNLLSIQYSGLGYVKGAAHPNNLFFTTNINVKKGNRFRLKDIVNIDEDFVTKFKGGKFKAKIPNHMYEINTFPVSKWKKSFDNGDSLDNIGTENHSDTFSYLTRDSLGISIGVSHAAGDHGEFEIKYQDIADNLKAENEIWKELLPEFG